MVARPTSRQDFEIAIVCALPIEYDAVCLLVDEFWDKDGDYYGRAEGDRNVYATGRIGNCNVVLLLLAMMGKANAAAAGASLHTSYLRLNLVLLTGICGVVPQTNTGEEIVLGDVIMSTAVIQCDFGRMYSDEFMVRDTLEERLSRPEKSIRNLLATLKTDRVRGEMQNRTAHNLRDLQEKARQQQCEAKYRHPGAAQDRLFESTYHHRHHFAPECICKDFRGGSDAICDQARKQSCGEVGCDDDHLVTRQRLVSDAGQTSTESWSPSIFVGRFGSGDTVMKSGEARDRLAKRHGLLAFETEGAGLWDELPCIVIKAACDYSDSHKNKGWQGLAAATAAAAVKAVLERHMQTCTLPEREATLNAEKVHTKLSDLSKNRAVFALSDAERDGVIHALEFPQIDARLMNLKAPEKRTCEWFLKTATYLNWRRAVEADHRFLWIKGKPGTGKSILMKFLFNEETMKYSDENRLVISFFFNARGGDLEKSALGLYRSLLFQLFGAASEFQNALSWLSHHAAQQILKQEWTLGALQQTFRAAIKMLGKRSLAIFVDALDECSEDDILDMVDLFEELVSEANDAQAQLRICLSSRHYPNIVVNAGLQMVLESEQGQSDDIALYIKSKLRIHNSPKRASIESAILEKSSRIFLWVALVIPRLNKAYSGGRVDRLEEQLAAIPAGLDALLEMIIVRDTENWEEFRLCLLTILFAYRSMKPEELWFAIHLAQDLNTPTAWDDTVILRDDMIRFANSSSKGMAELTQAGTVEFIHESVRDVLIRKENREILWPELRDNLKGLGHDVMKDCCQAQIKSYVSYVSRGRRWNRVDLHPFLEYATTHVFSHSNSAQKYKVNQHNFFNTFPMHYWLELNRYFNPRATDAPRPPD